MSPLSQTSPPTLLVVDDNAAFAENLREILGDEGFDVALAGSCAEARKAGPFQVALVDVRLPDGDGIALAAELKSAHPDSELLLLTGHATVESAAAAVRAGAFAYLVKPVRVPELLLAVGQAMRQVGLLVDKRELSRRTQVAEKLAAIGTLTAGLSHEIRNPLNAAVLQLTVLDRRIRKLPVDSQAPLLAPLHIVQDEIRRLDHILDDFLRFARPVQLVPRPVDVGLLLEKVGGLFTAEAEKKGITLEWSKEGSAVVGGDESRLQQVLVNLTVNALQATPGGKSVRLVSRVVGDEVVATVEDEGTGIAPEHLDRLFEPFFTTKPDGTGLGLSIVHAIVTQHGGTLKVENRPEGGARFTLRLPAARGTASPPRTP